MKGVKITLLTQNFTHVNLTSSFTWLQGMVIFSEASVCYSVHRGVGQTPLDTYWGVLPNSSGDRPHRCGPPCRPCFVTSPPGRPPGCRPPLALASSGGHGSGRCCNMGQNDTISKIELIPSSVLSENNTNYKNDIHKFSNSLSYQESTEIPIYTSRC